MHKIIKSIKEQMVKITKKKILIYIRIYGTIKEVQGGKIHKLNWMKKIIKKRRKMYWHYENNMVR